jgi:hypothetical protein
MVPFLTSRNDTNIMVATCNACKIVHAIAALDASVENRSLLINDTSNKLNNCNTNEHGNNHVITNRRARSIGPYARNRPNNTSYLPSSLIELVLLLYGDDME